MCDYARRIAANIAKLREQLAAAYLSCVETLLNVEFKLVPMVFTAAMIATEMPAAIRAYSIAVAAVWSFKNRVRS